MSKKVSKREIYQLLIGTHPDGAEYRFSASRIAKSLGVSRQYIYKIIKEFEGKGLIKCDNKKVYIKLYSPSYKSFENTYKKMSTKSEASSEIDHKKKQIIANRGKCPSPEMMIQKARYEILMEREYSQFFNNKKQWMHGNCKHSKFISKVFDEMGKFQFEKVGKEKLILIVPEMVFKKNELSIAKHAMFAVAYEAMKWFAKKAKIKFRWDTFHLCQKPHITRPAANSKAIQVARDWSLSIDGRMLDMSSGKADWEAELDTMGTKLFDDSVMHAVDALETWDSFAIVKSELEEFNGRISEIEEVQPKLNKKIDSLIEGMTELKEMMQPNEKKLDPDDPAFR